MILLTWFFGDAFKAFYYIYTGVPSQFILCGFIQLLVDSIIVIQFVSFEK